MDLGNKGEQDYQNGKLGSIAVSPGRATVARTSFIIDIHPATCRRTKCLGRMVSLVIRVPKPLGGISSAMVRHKVCKKLTHADR